MERMKTKLKGFLLALLLLNLRLCDSVTIDGDVVHIKFHLPPNALPKPKVIHHTHTQFEHHSPRRNPSSLSPVPKQPPKHQRDVEKSTSNKAYDDFNGEIDDPSTQESVHSFKAVERLTPRIYHHDEANDERFNYNSHLIDPDGIYYTPMKHLSRPIKTYDPDEMPAFEQEPSSFGHQSPSGGDDLEREVTAHDSYLSDNRYPYAYKTRNSASKIVEPQQVPHYASGYSKRLHRKSKNPFKSSSYNPRHHKQNYSYEDPNNNEPLAMDSVHEEPYPYKPMKSRYKTMPGEYYNHEPRDMMSGYHRTPFSRTPPKYVKFTAHDSYLPTNRYRRPMHHSSYKPSEPYMSGTDSYRMKSMRGYGLQGYEYSRAYPWL